MASTTQAPKPKLQPDGPAVQAVLTGQTTVKWVAGLDTASSRLAMYCNDGQARYCEFKGDPDERRHRLFETARLWFALLPAGTLLICEEPLALQNGKTTRLLGLAAGAIWAAHLDYQIFWAWADVTAWKKSVVGKGNADKDKIADWVRTNMGLEFDASEPDLYDAVALCRYGELAVGLA